MFLHPSNTWGPPQSRGLKFEEEGVYMPRYWIYTGAPEQVTIHRSDCGFCDDGHGGTQRAEHIGLDWWGFYPTRGSALDAAISIDRKVVKHVCVGWDLPK